MRSHAGSTSGCRDCCDTRPSNKREIAGAEHAVCLAGLPRLPLYILSWTGDESSEFRAIIGIDDRALFHMDLAGVFGLMNILVSRMVHES